MQKTSDQVIAVLIGSLHINTHSRVVLYLQIYETSVCIDMKGAYETRT
jgi:hypothetical protein